MAYVKRAQPPPLTPELLEAALAGASVRRLAAQHGLSRADAQGLARWAAPLMDALCGGPAAEGEPGAGEIVGRGPEPEPGAKRPAAPGQKTEPGTPARELEKENAIVGTPAYAAPADAFEDVPEPYRTPELAAVYREAFAAHTGAAR